MSQLDKLINFETAINALTQHFKNDDIYPLKIHQQGKQKYEHDKYRLTLYLEQISDKELDTKLKEFQISKQLQIKYTKEGCIILLFELHNFHQLNYLPYENNKHLSRVVQVFENNLRDYIKKKNLNSLELNFVNYTSISFFLRMEIPKKEFKSPSYDTKPKPYLKFKPLIGNFFPESTKLFDYEIPPGYSFKIPMSKLLSFGYICGHTSYYDLRVSKEIRFTTWNLIRPLHFLLEATLENKVRYGLEKQDRPKNRSIPNITISYNDVFLPFDVNNFSFRKYFENQTTDEEPGIRMNEIFSKILRECLSLKCMAGILSNNSEIIAIDFNNAFPSQQFYQNSKLLRKLSCKMYKLRTPLELFIFIMTCLTNPIHSYRSDDLLRRLSIVGGKEISAINHLYKNSSNFIHKLLEFINNEEEFLPSQLDPHYTSKLTEVPDKVVNDIYDVSAFEIKNLWKMVQQVSKKGRVYFKVLNMEDFNNSFYRKKWIQVISGSTFGSKNSIVVKIENEFGNESTLNIFDPIRTVPFTISNGNAHKSLALCLKNFVKEVFSLHQLRQFGFVPQISEFGVIINETARYVSEVTPNRMEDSGFFYNYPAKGKRLCEFSYKEVRYLEPTIRRAVSQMHQAGVAHLNLNSSNIIVQDLDSKKVCIIDFSHSYMEWHKNYQWPAYSYGTKIKTELPRNFSMAARLDLDSLDLISCCII